MIRAVACLLLLLFTSSGAYAQGVGFVGGGTIDPEQFYVGTFFETPPIGGSIHIRPGIDGSWGNGFRMAAINLDIIHRGDLSAGWQFYTGGGPTVLIARVTDDDGVSNPPIVDDLTGGFSAMLGFAHAGGFLVEFRYASARNGPSLKFGVGFQVRKKK